MVMKKEFRNEATKGLLLQGLVAERVKKLSNNRSLSLKIKIIEK
jgi:hypothetical protein